MNTLNPNRDGNFPYSEANLHFTFQAPDLSGQRSSSVPKDSLSITMGGVGMREKISSF